MANRFYIEIRGSNYRLFKIENGFPTRVAAETAAEERREEFKLRGWNMTVYVGE